MLTPHYRLPTPLSQVRVQGCGKSAPAASRGAGSVNPGWEQGHRNYGWSFTSSVQENRLRRLVTGVPDR